MISITTKHEELKKVKFSQLEVGDTFRYNDKLYIKLPLVVDKDMMNKNAFNCFSCIIEEIDKNATVFEVDINIEVKYLYE